MKSCKRTLRANNEYTCRIGDYNTQDVKGARRKTARLFTTLYNN